MVVEAEDLKHNMEKHEVHTMEVLVPNSCRNRVPDQQYLYLNFSYCRSKTTAL